MFDLSIGMYEYVVTRTDCPSSAYNDHRAETLMHIEVIDIMCRISPQTGRFRDLYPEKNAIFDLNMKICP